MDLTDLLFLSIGQFDTAKAEHSATHAVLAVTITAKTGPVATHTAMAFDLLCIVLWSRGRLLSRHNHAECSDCERKRE